MQRPFGPFLALYAPNSNSQRQQQLLATLNRLRVIYAVAVATNIDVLVGVCVYDFAIAIASCSSKAQQFNEDDCIWRKGKGSVVECCCKYMPVLCGLFVCVRVC